MPAITISLPDMTCGNCVRHVREALATVPALTVTTVDLGEHLAQIDIAAGNGAPDVSATTALALSALDDAGYPGVVIGDPGVGPRG